MAYGTWRGALLVITTAWALAGCLPEAERAAAPAPVEEPPNRAPVISGSPTATATAGTAWQFLPVASDADGDTLSFTASGLPGWTTLNGATGLVSGTPAESDVGTSSSIVITVSDGENSASLPGFSITVSSAVPPPPPPPPPPVNTRPVIAGTPALSVQATSAYTFVPSASDAETPQQSLRFSILNQPSWASFSTTTGALSGTPAANQAGTYRDIVISVSDGSLAAALPAFTITVTAAPNRPPVISGTPASAVTVGNAYSFRPTASDPDGQTLSYTIANKPSWATFSTSTGRLSGTPTAANVGTTSGIVITVRDSAGATAELPPFSITVNELPNRTPTISGTPATTAQVGAAYRFAPSASDADGDTLTWSITGKPADATFSVSTGELTWTPSAAGTFSNIVITVTDPDNASASLQAFTITVTAAPQTGSAALSWSAPSLYTDGTALPGTDLEAYRIYHGPSATALTRVAEVDSGTTAFTVSSLTSGTHFFAVTSVSAAGVESALSAVGSKTIP